MCTNACVRMCVYGARTSRAPTRCSDTRKRGACKHLPTLREGQGREMFTGERERGRKRALSFFRLPSTGGVEFRELSTRTYARTTPEPYVIRESARERKNECVGVSCEVRREVHSPRVHLHERRETADSQRRSGRFPEAQRESQRREAGSHRVAVKERE